MSSEIFIATILLEKNRWTTRIPSLTVSNWVERFQRDLFDGVELWEGHATLCGKTEFERLQQSCLPVTVFNTYADFTKEGLEKRERAAEIVNLLGAKAVKFNLGNDLRKTEEYVANLKEWSKMLPNDCRILSECHPGTIMEDINTAAEVLKKLKDDRFQLIIHDFGNAERMEKWFLKFGTAMSHMHVFLRDSSNKEIMLRRSPERCSESVSILKKYGYQGTISLEFTEGIGAIDESADSLYRCALEDYALLKQLLAENGL